MIKPKPSKEELKELASQAVKVLEAEASDLKNQINFLIAKIDDAERKVRWLKREILD